MMDVYMILMLAGTFGLFYGFAAWCNRVIDGAGGDQT